MMDTTTKAGLFILLLGVLTVTVGAAVPFSVISERQFWRINKTVEEAGYESPVMLAERFMDSNFLVEIDSWQRYVAAGDGSELDAGRGLASRLGAGCRSVDYIKGDAAHYYYIVTVWRNEPTYEITNEPIQQIADPKDIVPLPEEPEEDEVVPTIVTDKEDIDELIDSPIQEVVEGDPSLNFEVMFAGVFLSFIGIALMIVPSRLDTLKK